MKILLCNYRYFISGGPERYMFNVTSSLTANGNDVIPFSINYTRNQPTPYGHYFVEPLGSRDEVFFSEQHQTLKVIFRTFMRLFYAPDVERAVQDLIADTKPDVAYVLHYLRKLSPSLLVGLKRRGLPIVVRLSDYSMLCPAAICFRDGEPCELCVKGNTLPSVRYRCIKGSLSISAINMFATSFHRLMGYFDLINCFITTTEFMYEMMLTAGYPVERLACIPTFVDSDTFYPLKNREIQRKPYFVYIGRVDFDKGVHVLLEAWQKINRNYKDISFQLKIAGMPGFGDEDYLEELKSKRIPDVFFLGELEKHEIIDLFRNSYMSVVPSICYDNLPNALLESYASGVPVIAPGSGSFKECMVEGETGYLFEAGNSDELAQKMRYAIEHQEEITEMSKKVRSIALDKYSKEKHIAALESLFEKVLQKYGQHN